MAQPWSNELTYSPLPYTTDSSTGFSALQTAVFEQHHLPKLLVHLLLAKGASWGVYAWGMFELDLNAHSLACLD